jgi:ribonucleotide monophosphatase NagD (HAD superfamily)
MTCRIVQSLAEIGGSYQALLCDIWGCYHNGVAPYPAAVEALRAYRATGGIVILLTNAPRPEYLAIIIGYYDTDIWPETL